MKLFIISILASLLLFYSSFVFLGYQLFIGLTFFGTGAALLKFMMKGVTQNG